MRSVADDLRRELGERVARMEPSGRRDLAFSLGEHDLAALMKSRGLSRDEAKRVFARARTVGRVPSRSNDPDRA